MRTRLVATMILTLLAVGSVSAATVDGITIHWISAGTGPQTVVLVHGWTCDETSWQGQIPAISQKYRVITLDLPGHGKSGSPKDGKFSVDQFARAIEAVRIEAKLDKAVFAGHSMGTPVVREYALKYPQRVAALVLVDGLVLVAGSTRPFPMGTMTGPEGLKARENLIRSMFSAATTPRLQKQILQMMMDTKEATAAGAMQATWDSSWWKNDVILVPVLGLYADRSGLADKAGLNRLYPKLEYHEIAGTGHFLMMEKPQEFNRLLTDFLAKVRF